MSHIEAETWLRKAKKTYQPVYGYMNKISAERVKGFETIRDTIIDHVGDVKGKRFLDIGCNTGYFCLELAYKGALTVGVDRNTHRIQVAKLQTENYYDVDLSRRTQFICGNIMNMELKKNSFDYVILLNTIHHLFLQNEQETWGLFNRLIDYTGGVFIMMRNQLKTWSLCDRRLQIPDAVIEASHATDYVAYPPVHGRVIYFFYKK